MPTEIRDEIIVTLKNEPGALARVLEALSGAGVNLLAFCGYAMGPDAGAVHLVADAPDKAKAALDAAGAKYEVLQSLVIRAEDKPGAAAALAGKIAAKKINIEHCYATGVGSGAGSVVIRTSDNAAAKAAIE